MLVRSRLSYRFRVDPLRRSQPGRWLHWEQGGYLRLALHEAPSIVWNSRSGEKIPIVPPIGMDDVFRVGPKERGGTLYRFRVISFRDSHRHWELAITAVDGPLVQRALAQVRGQSSRV
jgi:hypothetical protein